MTQAPQIPLPHLDVLLASPRGFCAGVERAIQIVEMAIKKYGSPVYVRHEIVHNKRVVRRLEDMGAIFVDELDEVPNERPVIFSAHGVPKTVPQEAKSRTMTYLDATCPLVSKVHVEAENHFSNGLDIVLIGHSGHPEVVGTMGQLPDGAITLIETPEQAASFTPRDPSKLALITQTTLSVDDAAEVIAVLSDRFPTIKRPHKEDICYATTNRQSAVKNIAERCSAILVIGSPTSSNSMRLVEVAQRLGCKKSWLVENANEIPWDDLGQPGVMGITAGASAPEELVEEVLNALRKRFVLTIEEISVTEEHVTFKLPRRLSA